MKIYLFLFMAGATAVFFSYIAGMRVGHEKCRSEFTTQSSVIQSKTIKVMEQINAETFNSGTNDIRRVLREKYTIAE